MKHWSGICLRFGSGVENAVGGSVAGLAWSVVDSVLPSKDVGYALLFRDFAELSIISWFWA